MGGFSHFDNFWGAVVTLSQVFLPDSSYDVWNRAKVSYLNASIFQPTVLYLLFSPLTKCRMLS
jgi:hypothetical protein